MKGFLSKIGNTLAAAADSVAYYDVKQNKDRTTLKDDAGAPHDPALEFLLRNVRSKHVRQHFFKTQAKEYSETRDVRVLVGSYNVNGKKPPTGTKLDDWLGAWKDTWPASDGQAPGPDIVAIGFQEVVPLSAGNVIVGLASKNVEAWDHAVAASLNGEEWATEHYGPLPAADAPTATSALAQAADMPAAMRPAISPAMLQSMSATGRIEALTGGSGEQHYVQIVSKQMVGIYLSVWVRKAVLPHVRGIQTTYVATGFGGYLGNKGAVSARFYVYDSPICFVNSHLSSGSLEGDEAKRNADVCAILARCVFTGTTGPDQAVAAAPGAALLGAALGPASWGAARAILDHSNVVWMGDLNYRLNVPDEDARKHIRTGRLDLLLECDQLIREMAAGRVFQGWKEGPITFNPTFKYKLGTSTYVGDALSAALGKGAVQPSGRSFVDSLASGSSMVMEEDGDEDVGAAEEVTSEVEKQKKRTPAWCDRILWLPGRELHQLGYGRAETTASDHKPVCARFLLTARHYNRQKVEQLLDDARRAVDLMQMTLRPKPQLEPNVVSIGTLTYGEVKQFKVVLSNTGGAEGLFHFVPPPSSKGNKYTLDDDVPAMPAWLSSAPAEGIVESGSQCKLTLTVCIEGGPSGAAARLAQQPDDFLDAIVILRVEDGADLFLSLTGNYVKSTWLGLPLDALARSGARAGVVPEQLAHMVSLLSSASSLATPGLFVDSIQVVLGLTSGSNPEEELAAAAEAADAADSSGREAGAAAGGQEQHHEGSGGGGGTLSTRSSVTSTPRGASGSAGKAPVSVSRSVQRALLKALAPLVAALEEGKRLPSNAGPHEVAALLLLMYGELPVPLLPASAADLASQVQLQGPAASSLETLLADLLSPVELDVLMFSLGLFRKVVASTASCVSTVDMAKLLAAYWFPPLPPTALSEAAANRVGFISLLLE